MAETDAIEHLEWLCESRRVNLETGLKLLKILRKHSDSLPGMQINAQRLVAVAFSLWRAAFLADAEKTEKPGSTGVAHAITFLERLIQNNAINYSEDRNARNWTFGYYMNAASHSLNRLAETWPAVRAKGVASRKPSDRWNHLHQLFATAVDLFEADVAKVVVAGLKAKIASTEKPAKGRKQAQGRRRANHKKVRATRS